MMKPPPPPPPPPELAAVAVIVAELDVEVAASLHVAVTVKAYEVPAVRPETTHEFAVPMHVVTPDTVGTDDTE